MKVIRFIFIFLILCVISCDNTKPNNPSRRVSRPVFNPPSRSFTETFVMRIECGMDDVRIYYTTDGSIPTNNSSLYTAPITVSESTTFKAIAMKMGYRDSEVVTAIYSYNIVLSPIMNLPAGIYYSEQEISMHTPTLLADIYFTLNNADPIEHPQLLYVDPFVLPGNLANKITLKARAFRENWVPSEIVTVQYEFRVPTMIFVTGGVFSPANNYNVQLSDYYISNYEITQSEWFEVMSQNANNISLTPSFFPDLSYNPVETVSWYEAIVYCNLRSIKENLEPVYTKDGQSNPNTWGSVPDNADASWDAIEMDMTKNGYRLPTEMEWLFAARGGNLWTNKPYAGSHNIDEVAWYKANANGTTHSIGEKNPNELNLYDMSGNVWEWCWDWFAADFLAGHSVNPTGPISGTYRVLKGGSYLHDETRSVISHRGLATPEYRKNDHGFRIVRTR